MKKIWKKLHWTFKVSVTVLGGAATIWFASSKLSNHTPSVDGGVNNDTIISVPSDTIK